jgi:kindlin 2
MSLFVGIRHPEELSLCKPLDAEHLKQNYQETPGRKRLVPPTKDGQTGERIDTNTFISKGGRQYHSNGSLNGTLNKSNTATLQATPSKSNNGTMQFHTLQATPSKSNNGTMQFHSNPGTLRNGNYSPYNNGHSSPNNTALSEGDLSNLAHSPLPNPEVGKRMI